jgi:hypothetical protein
VRTLFTYVLAALAAAVILVTVTFLPDIAEVILYGAPLLAAGAPFEALTRLMIWLPLIGIVGSIVWALGDFAARSVGVRGGGIWIAVRASLIFWILFAVAGWVLFYATDLLIFERGGEMPPALAVFTALGLSYLPGIFYAIGGSVIGLAWGTVFWLRASKPSTAGAAA